MLLHVSHVWLHPQVAFSPETDAKLAPEEIAAQKDPDYSAELVLVSTQRNYHLTPCLSRTSSRRRIAAEDRLLEEPLSLVGIRRTLLHEAS